MIKSERHEILFCHDLLKFLEHKFPNAGFFDDFNGKSRSEFYFSDNNDVCIVEAKSDIEAKSTPWKGDKFQDIRDAIHRGFPQKKDRKYARWIIFLAQLNDYAKRFCKTESFNTMLGLPSDHLEDAKQGIEMLIAIMKTRNINLNLNYNCASCKKLNVSYLSMTKTDLSNFISSITLYFG